jgi:hypothetical protein
VRGDLAYTTSGDADSKLRLRRKHDQHGGLWLRQDTRDYYTSATFTGAKDPLTGIRFFATESIPQATDGHFSDSMFYTGEANHYTAPCNDALKSNAACRLAAREFLNITPLTPQGLPPWYLDARADHDPSARDGDLVTVNGIKFLLEGVEMAVMNVDGESGQATYSFHLAEDKKVDL